MSSQIQPRRFSRRERQLILDLAGGRCQECSDELLPGWHADHEIPFSAGGPTDLSNARALCRECNLLKGAKDGRRPV
jgi:5-methylcytosine-specific restriction endonuclease McrA